jgi:hypothetical protein
MGLPLLNDEFKQIISGMPISTISHLWKACCCYKSQKQFSANNAGKLSAMNMNGLSAISSLQSEPQGSGQVTFFG